MPRLAAPILLSVLLFALSVKALTGGITEGAPPMTFTFLVGGYEK
jgi:hypothetical protein